MMLRLLLVFLLALAGPARASDKIDASADGASTTVTQPHVTAELIPQSTAMQAGEPFDVALHLHMDAGWHTYWINPGDAGIPTTIKWTLPPGFTAGPIQWPTPEKHAMGPEVTYGYDGDVYLLTTLTPPKTGLPPHLDLKAKAQWLVCKEECIPGKAELTVPLDTGFMNLHLPQKNTELFAEAKKRLPVENTRWLLKAGYGTDALTIAFTDTSDAAYGPPVNAYFFPEQANVISPAEDPSKIDKNSPPGGFSWKLALQQNGERPDKLSGVLVSDTPLIGDAKAVQIAEFPVAAAVPSGGAATGQAIETPPTPSPTSSGTAAGTAAATPNVATTQPLLIVVLVGAFLGGLILNLMPCVLPVLSLKVFALIRHADEHPGKAWQQGAAFTAGVVLSFWALAGILIGLRAAGGQLGWGFQMQSPGFVAALTILFFLIALNLFGVFEFGTSLVGLDAKAASRVGGSASSFLNGALATVAATPCTAPFMGSALGFAAQQPPLVSMLVFTFLAFGMAAPYLLLTIFPQSLRFVPKPGAWMESLKQFMGFLLMGTVIFLLYVFGALVGGEQIVGMLGVLLLAGFAAWIYGRWGGPGVTTGFRLVSMVVCLMIVIVGSSIVYALSKNPPPGNTATVSGAWQPWSPDAVSAALAQDKPVFVDFTAAWCLSCKVNEHVALDTDAVKNAFTQKGVALFRADWTHADPRISATLQQYNRDGVPLYLLYSPKAKDSPQVLPAVLTPGTVLDALDKI